MIPTGFYNISHLLIVKAVVLYIQYIPVAFYSLLGILWALDIVVVLQIQLRWSPTASIHCEASYDHYCWCCACCRSFHGVAVDANFYFIRYSMIAVVLQIQLKWIPNNFYTLWGILWSLLRLCCGSFHRAGEDAHQILNYKISYDCCCVTVQIQLKWIPTASTNCEKSYDYCWCCVVDPSMKLGWMLTNF